MLARTLPFDDPLELGERRIERQLVGDFAIANDRDGDRDDGLVRRSGEQRRIDRTPGLKHLAGSGLRRVQRQSLAARRAGVEQLPAVAVGDHDRLARKLTEERLGILAETLEIVALQHLRQRQHLQAGRHAFNFAVQDQARRADELHHAGKNRFPVVGVVLVDKAPGKNDQRQQRASNQDAEPDGQTILG